MEAGDLRTDAGQLRALLDRMRPHAFAEATGFKGWTSDDILRHLLRGNAAARLALSDPQALEQMMRDTGVSRRDREFAFAGGAEGHALVRAWHASAEAVADAFAAIDPSLRVPWAGLQMSARSLLSARLMEQWAHGQAIYDLLGVERIETDLVRSVAVLGVNAFAWTFRNNGLPVPARMPRVELRAPSGETWRFGEGDDAIHGSAVDFCHVVTQARNIADTALNVTGADAGEWMARAQCFAGPPQLPPAPGSRRMASAIRFDLLSDSEGLVSA